MGRLQIAGSVHYIEGTPAAQATVTITDLDSGPEGQDDQIFEGKTDGNGNFSGLSKEWNDREGRILGMDIPDIMRLQFKVKFGTKVHAGPFLHFGNQSAPIIVPDWPPKPIGKPDRELVQIIYLTHEYQGAERALYDFIETGAQTITQAILGGAYRKLTFLKGEQATLPRFKAALISASGASTRALDVIFTMHGSNDHMRFADGKLTETTVRNALLDIPAQNKKKLRSIFSTACYGSTHLDTWLEVGFKDAAGSKRMYADSATTYAPMIAAWAKEKSYAEAISAANNADPLKVADNIARAYYTARGMTRQASDIDSHRLRAGTGFNRIYSAP